MWGRAPEQTGASPSVPTVMHSPSRVPAPPASLGPAAGARLHGAAWPEGPTAEGRCASTRALPLMYQVSRAVAAPGPGAWVARACPQSSEGFLSDSSSDSFTTTSSPSGCRRPRAQSRDSTNREMAATPALSTTVGSDRQGSAGAGAGRTERGICSLCPPQAPGEGGPGHLTRSCDNPPSTPVSRLDGVLVPSGGGCDIPERRDTVRGHGGPRGCGSPFLEGLSSCNKSRHSAAGGGQGDPGDTNMCSKCGGRGREGPCGSSPAAPRGCRPRWMQVSTLSAWSPTRGCQVSLSNGQPTPPLQTR